MKKEIVKAQIICKIYFIKRRTDEELNYHRLNEGYRATGRAL